MIDSPTQSLARPEAYGTSVADGNAFAGRRVTAVPPLSQGDFERAEILQFDRLAFVDMADNRLERKHNYSVRMTP